MALYNICHKKLIFLKNTQLVALLADHIPVFPFLPLRICIFHEMTRYTELRVILGIFIITVADKSPKDENDNKGGKDKAFHVLYKRLERFGKFSLHLRFLLFG